MEYNWIKLPLYDSWDYEYEADVGSGITLRIYYSDRTKQWSYDASYLDGTYIVQGSALIPLSPMLEYAITGVSGFMWMEPIAEERNEVLLHPDQIHKYYNLFYTYWED